MYSQYPKYVSVAQRLAKAKKAMAALSKKGVQIHPIEIIGRTIATTFWGKAWCQHLESFSDYSNRLPRGRTYVRNGSVCHLDIKKGAVEAYVSGSSLYQVKVTIAPLDQAKWKVIQQRCSGAIGSILELLQGKLSSSVMATVTDEKDGLFPLSNEIQLRCTCPDSAYMCKHLAAVLYGIGARLDQAPDLLFTLRGVDYHDLMATNLTMATEPTDRKKVKGNLSAIFDIDLEEPMVPRKSAKKIPESMTTETPDTVNPTQNGIRQPPKSKETRKRLPSEQTTQDLTSDVIKQLKQQLGLTKVQLAALLNVSVATLNQWEKQRGALRLRDKNRARIEQVLATEKVVAVAARV